jgi:hypothetical protein
MAQQPNVEIGEATSPRSIPQPGTAVKWRADKPGLPDGPDGTPGGGYYGTTGPDPGWGLKLVNQADLPEDDDDLRKVLTGLVLARAAALGRAPVMEDLEVALILCGYGYEAQEWVTERRHRWLDSSPHEQRPGAGAVAEVDKSTLVSKPDQLRSSLLELDNE